MEDIFRFGPRRIQLDEIDSKTGRVIEQTRNVRVLSEGGLNSMMEHGKTGMIIISACKTEIDSEIPEQSLRDDFEQYAEKELGGMKSIDSDALYDIEKEWLRRRNSRADKELKKDIMDAGFSFTPTYGEYRGSFERSYVVYCFDRTGKQCDFQTLKQFALDMCRKYKQESVYVQGPGEAPEYLDADGNPVSSSSSLDFKFNREGEVASTKIRRKKRSRVPGFTGDINFNEMYIPLKPASLNEQMRRDKQGEVIL